MKYNPNDERVLPSFSRLQRQGLYHESQADGHIESSSHVEPEPMPTINELPYQWPSAIERIIQIAKERDEFGFKKYGTRLQPFNGRDPLKDAFQEGLDLLVYIEQELFERPYKEAVIQAAIATVNLGTGDLRALHQAVQKLEEIQNK